MDENMHDRLILPAVIFVDGQHEWCDLHEVWTCPDDRDYFHLMIEKKVS
jgi:hypothetical protein